MLMALMAPIMVMAHEDHGRPAAVKEQGVQLAKINESYKRDVKPIFETSCFDCHSQNPRLPWYHALPGVRGLLESDMKEAKKHLDFSKDFPFQGHGSPEKDLKAIAEVIEDGAMPPLRYRLLHWGAVLNPSEREVVMKWLRESRKLLNEGEAKPK